MSALRTAALALDTALDGLEAALGTYLAEAKLAYEGRTVVTGVNNLREGDQASARAAHFFRGAVAGRTTVAKALEVPSRQGAMRVADQFPT